MCINTFSNSISAFLDSKIAKADSKMLSWLDSSGRVAFLFDFVSFDSGTSETLLQFGKVQMEARLTRNHALK